jgi:zinc protease
VTARARQPVLPPPRPTRLPPVLRHTLRNGLEVCIVEQHVLPVVDVRLVMRAGAAHNAPDRAGCAFLAADMLDEATELRGAPEIADTIELLGASLVSRASWDSSAVVLHVLEPRLMPALELLAEMVTRPAFAPAEFERVRDERLAAILQERADPHTFASQAFARSLYGADHPFGYPVGGSGSTVERVSADDARAFHMRYFTPRNAVLIMVGDVRASELVPALDAMFGDWTAGAAGASPAAPPEAPPRDRRIHIVHRPGAPQSELRIGHAGPPRRTPDYFPLHVANTVLGGSFSSRLNMLLREEKAYTYGAGSGFAFRADGGPFVVSTAVATAATADAVVCTVGELQLLRREVVDEAELERAKSYIVLGLPRTFETTGDIAEHVSEVALYDLGWDYFDRFAAQVGAVGAESVHAAVRKWVRPDELSIVVVGDATRIRADLEATGLGAVNVREEV